MEYGGSKHYLGDEGRAYFASQNQMAAKEAAVTVWKFQPWTTRLLANTLTEAGFSVGRVDVLSHALFPRWEKIAGYLPTPVFNCLYWAISVFKSTRQLRAIAVKSPATDA
jgi:hypothetical protein